MARRLLVATGLTFGVLLMAPAVGAQAATGDSVTGSGTAEVTVQGFGSVITPFEIAVGSGPSGENPTGHVSFAGFSTSTSVTCLEVRTVTFNPPFTEATMNLVTPEFGLVTLQISDGDPEGLPDFISGQLFSARSPTDCSPLPFGSGNVTGTVLTGDVDFVDAPPGPTSKEQCKHGGYAQFGFKNQGQCVASLNRPPKH